MIFFPSDFYLQILFYQMTASMRKHVFVFSTTFYKRLQNASVNDKPLLGVRKSEMQHKRVA